MNHKIIVEKHDMSDAEYIAAVDYAIAQCEPKLGDTVTVNNCATMEYPKMFLDDLANKIWLNSIQQAG